MDNNAALIKVFNSNGLSNHEQNKKNKLLWFSNDLFDHQIGNYESWDRYAGLDATILSNDN